MGALTRYFKPLTCGVFHLIAYYITCLKRYATHPEKTPIEKRYAKVREGIIKIKNDMNVDIIVEGLENIPQDENIYLAGNHLGDFDAFVMASVIQRPTSFVGKVEIKQFPIIPTGMLAIDSMFINREDLKQTLKTMIQIQKQLTTLDKNWAIFPEGTRLRDSRQVLGEFHPGTFRAPMKAGVKIVPFAIFGTDRIFKIKPTTYKRYPVFIKFLKPITKEEYENKTTEEVAKYVQDQVQKTISFDLRPKDHKLMSELYPNRYKLI